MVFEFFSLFLAAALSPALRKRFGRWAGMFLALLPLGLAVLWSVRYGRAVLLEGEALSFSHSWIPSLGIKLSFYLDGLSLLFSLLILVMGSLVLLYSSSYLEQHHHLGRFYLYLLLFMGAMLGVVTAGNVIVLFVFWEMTSLSSFLLIGFGHQQAEARRSALQALWITGSGGLAMLAGLLLLGLDVGSFEFAVLLQESASSTLSPWALGLILLGAFTKSAQFPFHFWLPNAMAAPTPVSAYLHSATMVKAGIYLLARLSPVFGETRTWTLVLTAVGCVTMILGAAWALRQTDLKLVLAYTTVSALGTLTLMLGVGTPKAVKAAMLFLLVHALYKGALFLIVGILDKQAGSRDLGELAGLGPSMPLTAAAAALAGLSMAGLPPLLGFIAKEALYEGVWDSRLLLAGVFLTSALTISAAALAALSPFWRGGSESLPRQGRDPGFRLILGPIVLAGGGLVLGVLPVSAGGLIQGAVGAVLGSATEVELALWHGFNPVLGLSLLALITGIILYVYVGKFSLPPWGKRWESLRFDKLYDHILKTLVALCGLLRRTIQHGSLRYYLLTVFIFTFSLTAVMLFTFASFPEFLVPRLPFQHWAVSALVAGGALAALCSSSHLASVAGAGVTGYGIALIYILHGAPDVAMTQLMVETLTVLLVALGMVNLPRWVHKTAAFPSQLEGLVAIGGGTVLGLLTWVVSSGPLDTSVSEFFAQASYLEAHGRNVVNVILVDFRALDTLGELVVLAIAGLGIQGLLWKGAKH